MKKTIVILSFLFVLFCACEKEKKVVYEVNSSGEHIYIQNEKERLLVCNYEILEYNSHGDFISVNFKRLKTCKKYSNWCGTGRSETGYIKILKIFD